MKLSTIFRNFCLLVALIKVGQFFLKKAIFLQGMPWFLMFGVWKHLNAFTFTLTGYFPFSMLRKPKALELRIVPLPYMLLLPYCSPHIIHEGIFLAKTIRSVFVRGDRLIVHYSMNQYSFGIRSNPSRGGSAARSQWAPDRDLGNLGSRPAIWKKSR